MLYFENAKESFESACGTLERNNTESEFYHRFAQMIPDKIDVDTLVLAFKVALQDVEREGGNILPYIALVPQYVRRFTSVEFAHEFRRKYNSEVLGLTQEELPDVDYGYTEVEPNIIDISNKDRSEVLAALYNASTPIGMGFSQYNPMTWTKEVAELYFEQYGKPASDGKTIVFDYILGRPVFCIFSDNLVDVSSYNYHNESGLGQKAISTCPNIEKNKK